MSMTAGAQSPVVMPDDAGTRPRVYLFNDTGRARHAGCRAVMRSINAELESFAQIVATHQVGSLELDEEALQTCDAVVVNGEGSIHHDSPLANFLLCALAKAQAAGKRTALINAVYQQLHIPPQGVLARLDFFSVREVRSAAAARQHGGCPRVLLDSAADRKRLQPAKALRLTPGVVKGGTHPKA